MAGEPLRAEQPAFLGGDEEEEAAAPRRLPEAVKARAVSSRLATPAALSEAPL
jgi:hypothetical protein